MSSPSVFPHHDFAGRREHNRAAHGREPLRCSCLSHQVFSGGREDVECHVSVEPVGGREGSRRVQGKQQGHASFNVRIFCVGGAGPSSKHNVMHSEFLLPYSANEPVSAHALRMDCPVYIGFGCGTRLSSSGHAWYPGTFVTITPILLTIICDQGKIEKWKKKQRRTAAYSIRVPHWKEMERKWMIVHAKMCADNVVYCSPRWFRAVPTSLAPWPNGYHPSPSLYPGLTGALLSLFHGIVTFKKVEV